jgi:hypothetical protein
MQKSKTFTGRPVGFERLEDRALLSVTATLTGGALNLSGTAASESVQLWQSGSNWKVQGIGTKVNGSYAVQTFPGVTEIETELGAGNDFIKVFNGTAQSVTITYNPSDTGLKITQAVNLTLSALFTLNSTAGPNSVLMKNVSFVGDAELTTGDASDSFVISGFRSEDSAGGLFVRAGNGTNSIIASNVQCGGSAFFTTGSGNDIISMSKFKLGLNLQVQAGNGNNNVSANNILTALSSDAFGDEIITGSGRDSISIVNYDIAGHLSIQTGDGTDSVVLYKLTAETLTVLVNLGNLDTVSVVNTTVPVATFDDVDGTNGIIVGSHNHLSLYSVSGFTHQIGI